MTTRKDIEGEINLCRSLLVVSLRDMLSSGKNYYTRKCKSDAKSWLNTSYETYFSFSNLIDLLYTEDVDIERLRKRLKKIFKNKRVKGTRNLLKILTEMSGKES